MLSGMTRQRMRRQGQRQHKVSGTEARRMHRLSGRAAGLSLLHQSHLDLRQRWTDE
jgi:hypothetical protein